MKRDEVRYSQELAITPLVFIDSNIIHDNCKNNQMKWKQTSMCIRKTCH